MSSIQLRVPKVCQKASLLEQDAGISQCLIGIHLSIYYNRDLLFKLTCPNHERKSPVPEAYQSSACDPYFSLSIYIRFSLIKGSLAHNIIKFTSSPQLKLLGKVRINKIRFDAELLWNSAPNRCHLLEQYHFLSFEYYSKLEL